MTSQESLNKSVIRHGFKIALKRNVLVTSLASILLVVVMGIPAIRHFTMYFGDKSIGCVFADKRIAILYLIIAAVIGIIQALVSFNFIYSRSAVNTYFSIGIKRSQLFNTRILAGAFHTFLSILLPIAVVAEINLIYSTSVSLILGNAALLFLGMFTTAFIAFSIATIVCSSTYTRVEGITYAFLANLLPTFILTGLNGFMAAFLWGNTYGLGRIWNGNYYDGLLARFTKINPLLFLKAYFSDLTVHLSPETEIFNVVPMFLHVVLMLAVAGLLIYFSKRIFIKRNVENTKIIGTTNIMAYLVISPVVFAGFSAFLYLTRTSISRISITTALLLGVALSTVIFSAFVFPLRVAGKRMLKKLVFYFFNLAICFVVIGIMISGGLGFTDYIPKNENIESMGISYKGMPGIILTKGMSISSSTYLMDNNGEIKLTNPDDIKLAVSLHEKIISLGWISESQSNEEKPEESIIRDRILVLYNLKNNKTIYRLYPAVTLKLTEEMLALDDTEAINNLFSSLMDGDMETAGELVPQDEGPMVRAMNSLLATGKIYIKDPLSRTLHFLGDNDEIAYEIRQALKTDFSAIGVAEKYFPSEPDKYQLYFINDYNDDLGQEFVLSIHSMHGIRIPIVIDSEYTNTMEVIKKYYEPGNYEIEKLYIAGNYNTQGSLISSEDHYPFYRSGILETAYLNFNFHDGCIEITDSKEMEDLYKLTRGIYHISDGGYWVIIKVKEQSNYVTRYIPRDLLPVELKEKLAVN